MICIKAARLISAVELPACCPSPAAFSSQADLLQFYANAGAKPGDSSSEGQVPLPLPPSQSSLPHYDTIDMFSLNTVHSVLGGEL